MKLVIAGGGTGGHLFPALAVAEVWQQRGGEVMIFISEKEIDALATKDRGELRFEKLPVIGMPNPLSPAIFGFLKRFRESVGTVRSIYKRFKPDAVLGMGGFTSTAPIYAGMRRKIPTFVHESNAIPGKANKLNARMVNTVLLGFEECAQFFPHSRCEVTGTPIRRTLVNPVAKVDALASFGLEAGSPVLLVMGGSQGAHGLNEAMIKALPLLKDLSLQIIHLTGPQDEQVMTANYRREGIRAHVAAFCHQMELAYSAADFAIARSGAASLTELSHFGLASILIPYPHAADDHQTRNAEIYVKHNAAVLMPQDQTSGESLAKQLRDVLENPQRLETMRQNARALAPANAAERVADVIEKFCVK